MRVSPLASLESSQVLFHASSRSGKQGPMTVPGITPISDKSRSYVPRAIAASPAKEGAPRHPSPAWCAVGCGSCQRVSRAGAIGPSLAIPRLIRATAVDVPKFPGAIRDPAGRRPQHLTGCRRRPGGWCGQVGARVCAALIAKQPRPRHPHPPRPMMMGFCGLGEPPPPLLPLPSFLHHKLSIVASATSRPCIVHKL